MIHIYNMADLPRRSLSDYKIEKTLGEGVTGKVVLAERKGNKVALKIFKDVEWFGLKEIRKEFRLAMKLNCRSVIQYRDIFTTEFEGKDVVVLEMEYFEGQELTDFIICQNRTGYRITPPELIKFLKHLLGGLNCLHSKGIAHNDIKPDNILFSEKELKIVDLGLLCHFASSKEDKCSYLDILGTVAFMSPDVASGFYSIIPHVWNLKQYKALDIWSLGVVVYLLISGDTQHEYLKKLEQYGNAIEALKEGKPREIALDAFTQYEALYKTEYKKKLDIIHKLLDRMLEKKWKKRIVFSDASKLLE